ncbi:metallophosphoesterase family protein [Pontivivens insulae]|uniref:Calcineurin-like phosphoesterase domain-containing protein n=1 Tax=Pontivivens insulae TaxID=1639689 RepID=A0A2R8A7L8_9RHOB|nr:metallophosphoesterase family protein [Pontivivens insulae]RED18288.1 putative phosphoesterase [Pontivivens insulae]SPF28186.1 hypothetical protein POI8812_00484 [Pontivivens insulae]
MTRLAILGDIHGNADALSAVLDAAKREGVTRILNTGDLLGYYHAPRAVLAQLSGWQHDAVRGNHEDMLAKTVGDPSETAKVIRDYGHGLSYALETVKAEVLDALLRLPVSRLLTVDGMRIRLAHGAPWDTDAYVYPDASEEILNRLCDDVERPDLIVLGHTHYQALWSASVAGIRIVNPGSVGQPRDRQPGAAWALLDTTTGYIDLRREPYDMMDVIETARRIDPHLPYLWTVLTRQ